MSARLTEDQHALMAMVAADPGLTIEALSTATGLDQARIAGFTEGAGKAWVTVSVRERDELILSADGPVEVGPLPERLMLAKLREAGGELPMKDASTWAREQGAPLNEVIRWGGQKGWYRKDGGALKLGDAGRDAPDVGPDERVLDTLAAQGRTYLDALEGVDAAAATRLLKGREVAGHKIKHKSRKERSLDLTDEGRAVLEDPETEVVKLRNQLTAEDLASGAWRDVELRPYDVTLPAETTHPHKTHPLMRILQETRRAFLRMGFCEIVSPAVESAFWNFDGLFQPQDHPARDMQDTFYVKTPGAAKLPDAGLVDTIRRTHETGGDTGSTGWGYKWSEEEARRVVLRTHTTSTTLRAMAENPHAPRKVFCVGRVFRNETISYKHLPEFTQVDGVIIDRHASFRHLLGTLAEFYRQMGFEKVKFKPAFFPYTEPSAEVFVWFEPKQTWIELGGSGVFRPEVTEPFGCTTPVLAWGLGLERLAMLRFNMTDIRQLFWSEIDVLREAPLCQ